MGEKFSQSWAILQVKPFPEVNTLSNICNTIQVVNDYKITPCKVHTIVHDNATDMVNGVIDTGFNSISYFLHTNQLVIHDAIFEQRMMKDIFANCRRITGYFNKSSLV